MGLSDSWQGRRQNGLLGSKQRAFGRGDSADGCRMLQSVSRSCSRVEVLRRRVTRHPMIYPPQPHEKLSLIKFASTARAQFSKQVMTNTDQGIDSLCYTQCNPHITEQSTPIPNHENAHQALNHNPSQFHPMQIFPLVHHICFLSSQFVS